MIVRAGIKSIRRNLLNSRYFCIEKINPAEDTTLIPKVKDPRALPSISEIVSQMPLNPISKFFLKARLLTCLRKRPSFTELDDRTSIMFTPLSSRFVEDSNLVFTPRFQLHNPSDYLLEYMEDEKIEFERNLKQKDQYFGSALAQRSSNSSTLRIGKKRGTEERTQHYRDDAKRIVKALLEEIVSKYPEFDYMEDYGCLPTKDCEVHGTIDFLLYRKEGGSDYGFPMIPIYIPTIRKTGMYDQLAFDLNRGPICGITHWLISAKRAHMAQDKAFRARVEENRSLLMQRAIFTTGHIWQLIEVSPTYHMKRTHLYKPESFQKIFYSPEFISLILGMISYGLPGSPGEQALEETYTFLRDLRYMEKLTEDDKVVIRRREKLWGWLPNIRRK